jgi:hypothetical protein
MANQTGVRSITAEATKIFSANAKSARLRCGQPRHCVAVARVCCETNLSLDVARLATAWIYLALSLETRQARIVVLAISFSRTKLAPTDATAFRENILATCQ